MANTISRKQLRQQLKDIQRREPRLLRAAVAEHALDTDDPYTFFHDLLNHGCASGMVPGLIYYVDTRAFYDEHYFEIEELREDYEDNQGCPIEIKGDLKNFLAWFGFEETAYQLANELGIEW